MIKSTRFSLYLITFLILLTASLFIFTPKPPLLQTMDFSRAVYDKQQHLLRLTLTSDEKYRLFTPLSEISPFIIEATLLQEDQYFYWHPGVNPFALIKATWKTYGVGERRFGASTITMQVARMRFHLNSKTFNGKLLQILRALQLEMFYSKKQILEAYLNLASYGSNIEGVGAASLIYFGKPAQQLSLPQALTLAVIPQNPLRKSPTPRNQLELKNSRNQLFLRWLEKHPEDQDKKSLLSLPLQLPAKQRLPFIAPHYVTTILQQTAIQQNPIIITTLNVKLQKILEHTVQRYLEQKNNLGINNLAVMLVDTRTMEVKALIGSGDFFDPHIQGQINGTRTKRSPGSTLKPFIYALALDQGLIHPYTILKDTPSSFGAYTPDNFDYDFMGPIKASDALTLSRNIPAIYLASKLSHPDLYQFLQQAGITQLKPESHYGLSLVLGGAEVTMEELVELYATLANNGMWKPVRYKITDHIITGKRLLSPEASFLTLDMLKNTTRPQPLFVAARNNKAPVSWKTGTSSGYRDAWTVGVFGPYVLAVWIGNFDSSSNPAFVGKDSAAPLFFAIDDAIETQTGPLPNVLANPKRLHLKKIAVCEASGALPTRYCPHTVQTWFIPGKSPIKTDTVFREVMIDSKTGLRACHFDPHNTFAVYEFWPSDLVKIFQQAGIQRRTPPPFDPDCNLITQAMSGTPPHITSPQSTMIYTLRTKQQLTTIPFTAIMDADVRTLYWFINQAYIGKSTRDQPLLWSAISGNFVVRVADDHGRTDAVNLQVQSVR